MPPSFAASSLNIIAILVAFDRQRDPLAQVPSILARVSHLVIVDNNPGGHPSLAGGLPLSGVTVLRNANEGGLAGAYNAALLWVGKFQPAATHVLFLDDDTDANSLESFLLSPATLFAAHSADVAAVSPAYVDRQTGLRGAHIRLGHWSFTVVPREHENPIAVSFLINSMSLWKLAAMREIGDYSTQLAIDHVDTDYCLRASLKGFRLILNPEVRFLHSIGQRRQYRFLGRTLQSGGHSPQRREMIARNTVLLGKHYIRHRPSFGLLCLIRIAYEALGIVMIEQDKRRKLLAVVRGVFAGLWQRYA